MQTRERLKCRVAASRNVKTCALLTVTQKAYSQTRQEICDIEILAA